MSVPTQKCRTPMSRKYFASSALLISARGGTPIFRAVSNTLRRKVNYIHWVSIGMVLPDLYRLKFSQEIEHDARFATFEPRAVPEQI